MKKALEAYILEPMGLTGKAKIMILEEGMDVEIIRKDESTDAA